VPTLNGVWRTIYHRFITRINTPVTIDIDTEAMRKDRRAERRALVLLTRLLNPEQRQEFRNSRHFHVVGGSSGDRYRIRVGKIANIDALRNDGTVKYCLCFHPTGGVPVYDVMAAQLLYLQDPVTEQRLLRQANIYPARRPEERGFSSFN
jgi:hypothetical protein